MEDTNRTPGPARHLVGTGRFYCPGCGCVKSGDPDVPNTINEGCDDEGVCDCHVCAHVHVKDTEYFDGVTTTPYSYCADCDEEVALSAPDEDGATYWEAIQ